MAFDLDELLEKCYAKKLLRPSEIQELCNRLKELLMGEGNVRQVKSPVTGKRPAQELTEIPVVGDVHGQFFDVLEIFKIGGPCPITNYIFLGDYVDRGHHSVETITLLACLKLRYPNRVTLVRGNQYVSDSLMRSESRAVTATYGFYTEIIRKFGDAQVWTWFTDLFDYLILAAEIDNSILCVHGGLSPSIHTVDQIRIIDRFREIPHEG
ncbi:putative serine/threonine protein phosphatase [Kappamyces sp. JEL0829]|nr:putative serine/threonine protein phosphatase [Kappamyces sp. JEL0829]